MARWSADEFEEMRRRLSNFDKYKGIIEGDPNGLGARLADQSGDYVFDKTGSPAIAGLVKTAGQLAPLALGLIGGHATGEHPSAGVAAKTVDVASDPILSKITTPEQARELSGADRQAYLDALDKTYGPREQRAKDMGFGDKTWYHGTNVPIESFKNAAKGLSTNAQSAKRGFFFAEDPSTASDYADLAHEKGVIREGDDVTTKYLSDTAELHNEINDKIRDLNFDINNAQANIRRQVERNDNTKAILDYARVSKKPMDIERLPDLEASLERGNEWIQKQQQQIESIKKTHANLVDQVSSSGQNVLPVRLRPGEGGVLAKDYGGQGYRDVTYADVMQRAMDRGKSGVLFKNTEDPADPHNRVEQNIAAVFNPNQVRSVNAAFDPRFAKSSDLLAAKLQGGKSDDMNETKGSWRDRASVVSNDSGSSWRDRAKPVSAPSDEN